MNNQLETYIEQSIYQDVNQEHIYEQLLQNGWSVEQINCAFSALKAQAIQGEIANTPLNSSPIQSTNGNPHRVRNALLWIFSAYIILISAVIVSFLARQAGIRSHIINILVILMGMAGVILIPVGLITGVVKLNRHS